MQRTVITAGLAYFLSRQRLTNKERLDKPPAFGEALAIAKHPKVPMAFRQMAVHRAIDAAYEMKIEDGNVALDEIVDVLRDSFEEGMVSVHMLNPIAIAVPNRPSGQWAQEQLVLIGAPSASDKEADKVAA